MENREGATQPDDINKEELQRIAKRRMIIAAISGIILMVIMFFAGKMFRTYLENRNNSAGEYALCMQATQDPRTCDINLSTGEGKNLEFARWAGKL